MPANLPDECLTDLCTVLQELRPQQVLIATAESDSLRSLLDDKLPDGEIVFKSVEAITADIQQLPMYDVVVLFGVIEQLDKHPAETLMGCLRDLHARHLFVLVPIGNRWPGQNSHWQQSDLLALGLSAYKTYHVEEGMLQWYRFELENYKATPDWLNSKYWANPELFGKFRW